MVTAEFAKRQLELFPTAKEAARVIGIGRMTVGRILNGATRIRVETERKILKCEAKCA